MVWDQPPKQPKNFQIAPGLTLKTAARLHAVQVPVNVKLQKHRRMKAGPPGGGRLHAVEPQIFQIERIDKGIDGTDWVFFIDPVIKALRQQRRLDTICSFHEPLNNHPRRIINGIINRKVFSHSQGQFSPLADHSPRGRSGSIS